MSRIFDSLRKAGGKAADVALPLIDKTAPAHGAQPLPGAAPLSGAVRSSSAATPEGSQALAEEQEAKATQKIRVVKARPVANLPVLPFDGSHPASAEQYRIIRTKIVQHPSQPRMVAVSSPSAGDGKTISALNIAGALSLKGEMKVLLVESDFRRSSFCRLLQLPDEPGLVDVLARKCTLEDAIMEIEQLPNLFVLGAGEFRPDASELLDSPFGRAVFQGLRKRFHYVVLDCPPIGSIADYDVIQAAADGLVAVLRPDHTNRGAAMEMLSSLPKEKLLGVVMNHVKPWFLWRNTHSSYYYAEASADRD
jgi:capsular exopolysaccharide synthesis family protein